MPALSPLVRRSFNPGVSSSEFSRQWSNPTDVFSVLLLLGGDVVARALAQLAGSPLTPVAFSFGWVAYAVTAIVNTLGYNTLMPVADSVCKVINGHNGFIRDNSSWIIGRMMRDFETWMDDGRADRPIRKRLEEIINEQWRAKPTARPPPKAGLCVSVYKAGHGRPGHPGYDKAYFVSLATMAVQFGLAAIPFGLYGHWAILLVTAVGTMLSFATGALPQWKEEKWACRCETRKIVVLTRGNGSQHAIMIIGDGKGLDLEDLAGAGLESHPSKLTRFAVLALATLWVCLLITAAGIGENTWFLLAIGGIGIIDNIYVAGVSRRPQDYGIPLQFVEVFAQRKVMQTLYQVESTYPRVGKSMLAVYFPGELRPDEVEEWNKFDAIAKDKEAREKQVREKLAKEQAAASSVGEGLVL